MAVTWGAWALALWIMEATPCQAGASQAGPSSELYNILTAFHLGLTAVPTSRAVGSAYRFSSYMYT